LANKFARCCFFFLPLFFCTAKKWDCSLNCGLPSPSLRLFVGLRPPCRIPLEMPFFCLFSKNRYAIPAKSNSGLWQISFARPEFFFLRLFFAAQKMGLLTLRRVALRFSPCGLRCSRSSARCAAVESLLVPNPIKHDHRECATPRSGTFAAKNRYAIPAKSNSGLWQISFARPEFLFLLCYFLLLSHFFVKIFAVAAHCGQSRALLRSPLPASIHYAATSGRYKCTLYRRILCEDSFPRFSLAKHAPCPLFSSGRCFL